MIITIHKEALEDLIKDEIKSWELIGGGPNPAAYEFDPDETSPKKLKELKFQNDKDAWIAGARIKALEQFRYMYIEDSKQL